MVYWRGQPLETLPRADLEQAAREALGDAFHLQSESDKRDQFADMVICFVLGAAFILAAVSLGLLINV
jgi:hypothetical protein